MEIRGSILKSMGDFLIERYGEGNYDHWLTRLSPEAREFFERKIDVGGWYPITSGLVEPAQVLLDLYFGGHVVGARALGFFNAEKALTGFLKFVVKRGSPAFIIRQASSILQKYYKPLVSEVPLNEKGHAIVRITEFPEPHEIIDYRIQGWMEKALEVSGCRNIKVEIAKSMMRGDEVTEFEGSWE